MMMMILVVMMTVLVILAEMVMTTNTRQTQKPHCLKAKLPTSTPTLKTLFLFCKYELHNMNTRFLTRDGIVWWLGQKCTGEYNPKLQEGDQLVERIANQDNVDGYDDDGENYEKGDYDDDDDDYDDDADDHGLGKIHISHPALAPWHVFPPPNIIVYFVYNLFTLSLGWQGPLTL